MHPETIHPPLSSGFHLQEMDTQDWGLGLTLCCYSPKLQTLFWEVMGGSTPRCWVYPRAVLDPEMPCLRSCMGSRSSRSSLSGCPVPAAVPAAGSRVPYAEFEGPRTLAKAPGALLLFLLGDGAGLKGGGLCGNQECQEGREVGEGCQPPCEAI